MPGNQQIFCQIFITKETSESFKLDSWTTDLSKPLTLTVKSKHFVQCHGDKSQTEENNECSSFGSWKAERR